MRFHAAFAPFEVLTSVVAQELLAGARGDAARVIKRSIIEPFERRNRIIVPSHNAWKECGDVLAKLVGSRAMRWTDIPRRFVNDVLLAVTCRENGIVLVTENTRDCERIAAIREFDFTEPWPQPTV